MNHMSFSTALLIGLATIGSGQTTENTQAGPESAGYLTAANQFIHVGGVRFAYRKLGKNSAYPLGAAAA